MTDETESAESAETESAESGETDETESALDDSEPTAPPGPTPWGARLAGGALLLSLLLPWEERHDVLMTWDKAEYLGWAFLALPIAGSLLFIASFLARHRRRVAMALAGLAVASCGLRLAIDVVFEARDFRDLTIASLVAWGVGLVLAAGAELAMHERAHRRRFAISAAVGWLVLLGAYLVPFGLLGELDSSFAGRVLEMVHRKPGNGLLFLPALLPVVGFVRAVRRARSVGGGPTPTGRPWLVWLLLPIPAVLLLGVVVFSSREALQGVHWVLLAFGAIYGTAVAIQHSLVLAERVSARRAGAVAAGIVVAAMVCWFATRPSSNASVAFADDVATEVTRVLRGDAPDPRFLGGFSEFDLRGTQFELPEDATLVMSGFRMVKPWTGTVAWAFVEDGVTQWLCVPSPQDAPEMDSPVVHALSEEFELGPVALSEARWNQLGAPFSLSISDCSAEQHARGWLTPRTWYRRVTGWSAVDRYVLVYRAQGRLVWVTGSIMPRGTELSLGAARGMAATELMTW